MTSLRWTAPHVVPGYITDPARSDAEVKASCLRHDYCDAVEIIAARVTHEHQTLDQPPGPCVEATWVTYMGALDRHVEMWALRRLAFTRRQEAAA